MRIGIISQWFDPEPGPARLPGALARALQAKGHDVKALTAFPNYPEGRIFDGYRQRWNTDAHEDGLAVRRVPVIPSHSASVAGRLANYGSFGINAAVGGVSALRDVDAVWVSNSPITVALPMWRLARQFKVPVLLHVLDLWPDNVLSSDLLRSRRTARLMANGIHRWNAWMYRNADHVAAISPGIVTLLQERGVPNSKLSYIPMWANEETFYPGYPGSTRSDLGVSDDCVVVLYAGTLGRAQAIDTLIDACRLYPLSAPVIEVWIAGSGVEESALLAAAITVNNPRVRIRFLGRVANKEMTSVMSAADVHYIGLRDDENTRITMPSKLQATLASAKPIIIAVPGNAESVVLHARAGFSARPGVPSSVSSSLEAAARVGRVGLREMGKKARVAYDQEFSLAAGADRVEALLLSMSQET